MGTNTTDQFQVEHIEYVSDQPFDDVVAALENATGDVTDGKNASAESGTPELELHGAKTGNCLRAAIGLSEAGLHYQTRHVDLGRGEQRDEPHLALNPAGKVPVLVAGGSANAQAFVLTQSSAILFYADAQAPGRILPPHGNSARMRALEKFFYFTSDVMHSTASLLASGLPNSRLLRRH